MPKPTPAWDLVTVRGKYVGTDGNPVAGTVFFTPRANRLVDQAALTTVVGRSITATLASDGSFSVSLPATNDPDITGGSFTYTVREDFPGGSTYDISVPISAIATGIDLSTVAPVAPNTGSGLAAVTRLEFDQLSAVVAQGGAGGSGVPNGGATGQVLTKNSSTNGDASWSNNVPAAGKLVTPRTINGVSFDGSANISIPLAAAPNVADTVPADGAALVYDGNTSQWTPEDLTTSFAPVDGTGRLSQSAWQKYFVPMVVLDEGAALPSDFPIGGIRFDRVADPSLVPSLVGSNFATGVGGSTVTFTTNQVLNVGDWVGIAIMGSGEVTLPITHTFGLSSGAWSLEATNVESHQTGSIQVNFRAAKVTTQIPAGATVTITYSSGRAQRAAGIFKMPNLAATAPIDKTGASANSSQSSATPVSFGTTAATVQAHELAIGVFGHNDSTAPTTRPAVGANGWTSLFSVEADSGTGSRTVTVLYKELSTTGIQTGSVQINASDAATGAWAGVVATLKGA